MDLRESYLNKLYEYAINKVTSSNSGQYTCRAYIVWHYMYFMEEIYGRYDIEAIIEYLAIPKVSSYMRHDEGGFFKAIKTAVTGQPQANVGARFDFLTAFNGVPSWDRSQDTEFMKRFLLKLFQYPEMWQTFINLKSNEIRSSTAKSNRKKNAKDVFKQWMDEKWLNRIEAEAMLYSGDTSKTNECVKLLSDSQGKYYVDSIKDSVIIEFDKSAPKQCKLSDDIKLSVHVKNVTEVLVKIFEINTRSYFRDKQRELETDLNLDGLNASEEWTIDTKELGLNSTFHKKKLDIPWPKTLDKKRGIYFVDLIANGQHARAVIKIGTIKFFHRITEAGHVFQLLDEESKIIKDATIWMAGHSYHSKKKKDKDENKNNENAEIFIPFSNSPRYGQKIILQRNDDPNFNVLASFDHKSENYRFQCGLYVDREQLLEKKRAKIIVRSALFLNGNRVSVGLIENCKLSINIKTSLNVDVDKTFNNFELFDDKESTEEFTVPNECFTISLSLIGEVKNITNKNTINISKNQTFTINKIDKSRDLSQFHLIPCNNNKYIILLSGKNGEGLSNLDCTVTLYHRWLNQSQQLNTLYLTTNKKGRIYLPSLDKNFYKIQVQCSSLKNLRNEWLLESGLFHCDTPNVIQMKADDIIKIPFIPTEQADDSPIDYKYKNKFNGPIMSLYDKYLSTKYNDNIKFENGYIIIGKLKTGSYILKFLDDDMQDISINVTQGDIITKGFISNKNEIVELSPKELLQIQSVNGNRNKGVDINIGGLSKSTRVHVIATHFIPRFSISQYLDVLDPSNLKLDFMANAKNVYLKQRMIGEEYRYVLERQTAPKFIGNSLQRPSLLIKPLEHESTETKKQEAKKGDNVEKKKMADVSAQNFQSQMKKNKKQDRISIKPNEDRANLEFVGQTALILPNLKPNDKGIVHIDTEQLNANPNHNLLRIIAMDEEHVAIKSFVLENSKEEKEKDIAKYVSEDEKQDKDIDYSNINGPIFGYRDIRLSPGLDINKSFTEQREIAILLKPKQEFKIVDYLTSSVETYQTILDLFNLLQTISGNNELKEKWSFLHQWDKFNDEQKMNKYEDFMCHELNLFLRFKDEKFFETVAKPLISAKLYKDVIDLYLLNDVEALKDDYTQLNQFQQLNPLEKILIASVIPEIKQKTLKYFIDKDECLTVDPQKMDRLFQTALASKALQDDNDKDKDKNESKYDDEDEEIGGLDYNNNNNNNNNNNRRYQEQRNMMSSQQLYKQVEKTKEYQETYYYNIKYERNTKYLVPNESKFWCSFGKYFLSEDCGKVPFLSDYVLLPTSSINEILLALAVIGLPFKSQGPQFIYPTNNEEKVDEQERNQLILRATSPTIVFAKQLKESETLNMSQISIHMHYYDETDKYMTDENGERVDKFVERFVPGKIYACRAILTNVSSIDQQIEILSQIPTGSIPVDSGFKTRTTFKRIRPYTTDQYVFYFYFPEIGKFRQFPVTVSKKGKILGQSKIEDNLIVAEPDIKKPVDVFDWKDVSLKGKDEEIIKYLQDGNVYDTDLSRIYYRIKDNKTFFNSLINVLDSQLKYDPAVWGYCCEFKDDEALKKFLLMRSDFTNKLGPYFNSNWLGLYDDVLFGKYSHLEYIPLVNSRAHLLGQKRQILNDKFKKQYETFLKRVSYRSCSLNDIPVDDKLAAIYYLLLQDRISEALYIYQGIKTNENELNECNKNYSLTYDYLTAYMSLYNDSDDEKSIEETINIARNIATKYGGKDLPQSKRKLFEDIEALLSDLGDYKREEDMENDEEKKTIINDLGDRDRVMDKLAETTPSLEFEIKDRKLFISYQLLEKCTVNFYTMNTEVLFSFSPFLNNKNDNDKNIFSYIAPNESINVILPKPKQNEYDSSTYSVDIPKSLQNENLFVQVVSDTITESSPFYDHQLIIQLKENYGHLRVLNKNNPNKCIKRAYIKVYAKMNNGSIEFYKDGYTDIRGGFDYASISTDQIDRAKKFSILIADEKFGCLVKEANVPKQ